MLANKDSIFIFTKQSKGFVLFESISTPKGYDFLLNSGNKIFLERLYNYHPLDASNHFGIVRFDYRKRVFSDSLVFPYPGIEFSHLVNRWVSSTKTNIFVALTTQNKVLVVNHNLRIVDTISLNKNIEDCLGNTNAVGNPTKTNILSLMSRDTTCERIEKIFALNDSTLLISSIFPKSNKRFRKTNIVQKVNSKWVLISSQIFPNEYTDSENISLSTFRPNLSYSLKIESNDNVFVYTLNGQYMPKKKMNYLDYKIGFDKFYNKKEPKYRIIMYHVIYQ
jgi:hypothetical protein